MIKNKHLFFMILFTQFGVTISQLPYKVFQKSGHDGWITIIITGLIIQLILLVYYSLYKSFPNKSFFQYTKTLTNPFIGSFINICYFCYFFYICSKLSLEFTNVIYIWMFPSTPPWVILALFLVSVIFVAKENLQTIGRTTESFSIIFVLLLLMLLVAYRDVHFGRVLPIAEHGLKPILSGISPAFVHMLGFEIFLFLSENFQDTRKKLFTISITNLISTLLFTFITFTVYIYLSNKQNSEIIYPILYIFRGYQLQMIEHLHIIFLNLWTIVIAISIVIYLYVLSDGIKKQFNIQKYSRLCILIILSLLLVSMYPLFTTHMINKDTYMSISRYLDLIFIIIIPCLMLVITKVGRILS